MQSHSVGTRIALVVLIGLALPAGVRANSPIPLEITATSRGHDLAVTGEARSAARGVPVMSADLRVWQLAPGEFLVGRALPRNLRTSTVTATDGETTFDISYDVGTALRSRSSSHRTRTASLAAPASASWIWLDQGCFSRVSSYYGWLDSCYVEHGMINETDARDFYQLEQYGTVGARWPIGKVYSGWLQAQQASGSAPMSWIDWSPRGSKNGVCQSVGLSINVLGVGISSWGVMCESWIVYKDPAGGHFKAEWSCGCIYPFGQPYPNTREIDYMQAISVPDHGGPSWTLSAGFLAH